MNQPTEFVPSFYCRRCNQSTSVDDRSINHHNICTWCDADETSDMLADEHAALIAEVDPDPILTRTEVVIVLLALAGIGWVMALASWAFVGEDLARMFSRPALAFAVGAIFVQRRWL